MHNYLVVSQIAINLGTNFPLGREAMGRNRHYAQVGTAAFLSLHCECSLLSCSFFMLCDVLQQHSIVVGPLLTIFFIVPLTKGGAAAARVERGH